MSIVEKKYPSNERNFDRFPSGLHLWQVEIRESNKKNHSALTRIDDKISINNRVFLVLSRCNRFVPSMRITIDEIDDPDETRKRRDETKEHTDYSTGHFLSEDVSLLFCSFSKSTFCSSQRAALRDHQSQIPERQTRDIYRANRQTNRKEKKSDESSSSENGAIIPTIGDLFLLPFSYQTFLLTKLSAKRTTNPSVDICIDICQFDDKNEQNKQTGTKKLLSLFLIVIVEVFEMKYPSVCLYARYTSMCWWNNNEDNYFSSLFSLLLIRRLLSKFLSNENIALPQDHSR